MLSRETMPRAHIFCPICTDSARRSLVADGFDRGLSNNGIYVKGRAAGLPMSQRAIARHRDTCPTDLAHPLPSKRTEQLQEDVAVLVQREVVEKLRKGEARVTVQHGLQAQALIDRREERAKDRELAVTLARMLHTSRPPAALISARDVTPPDDEVLIDGQAWEVLAE